ncbi:MAG TPA: DUF669 domain-containing protein [Pirellulaceae bacterium]|nr:DUF669 domain-containing protein [Pirellulaceae bacterium]
MGKLSDILGNGSGDKLRAAWSDTQAADEFEPLPAGTYVARVVSGELFTSRTNGTPGYKLAFKVLEGEHAGRQVWLDVWLTEAALPMAKRDLAKLGVVRLEQLEAPLPRGIRCSVRVALRTADDGTKFNVVRSFEVVGIDPPDVDPFAPAASSGSTTTTPLVNLDAEPTTSNVEGTETPPAGPERIPF